jgi:hypothetical protein
MTKRRYSSKRHNRRYNRIKRGGENTVDTLDALERGEKYDGKRAPFTYNPANISVSQTKKKETISNANEFFDNVSKGIEEQSKLETKYRQDQEAYNKQREMIEKLNTYSKDPALAEQVFSGLKPEIEEDINAYTNAKMDPFTYGQGTGGKKSRSYTRRGRHIRKRKTRKTRKTRKY